MDLQRPAQAIAQMLFERIFFPNPVGPMSGFKCVYLLPFLLGVNIEEVQKIVSIQILGCQKRFTIDSRFETDSQYKE